jgi:transcriptional repressor NrdR
MKCPYCGNDKTRVIDTTADAKGGIRRRRKCEDCNQRFSSYERVVLTPMIVKKDGTREEFDREKLIRGIRVSCAKRPVASADIERLAGEVEAMLQGLGRSEVPSRVLGDMVLEGLRHVDDLAYIRYAIVYLELDDLGALRQELERLLERE